MKAVTRIIGAFTVEYLFKSYVISAVILFFLFRGEDIFSTSNYVYFIISALLFPFAAVIWDKMVHTLTNGTTFVLSGWWIIFSWCWKVIKCFFLFLFTPLIAPMGILYLWLRTR